MSRRWKTQDYTWSEIVDKLKKVQYTDETFAEYKRMSKEEKLVKKNAAGAYFGGSLSGARRCNGNVVEHTLLTLDADNGAHLGDVDAARMLGLDCAMVVHSTHSHADERPRLRYIAPLSRPCNNDEYQAVARKVAEYIGIETIDATCYDPCHAMFWPTCSRDATYYFKEFKGPMLNPDELLAEYGPGQAWRDVSLWPMSSRETEIIVREAKKQGDPETKPGIVGKFCRAYDVESAIETFLPDVYERCETPSGKPRYTYSAGSSSGGAVVEDGGKFLYSHHATDPAGGMLLNAFDLVRVHKFGAMDEGKEQQEITRRPSYAAMCEFAARDEGFRRQVFAERLADLDADFGDMEEQTTSTAREPARTREGEDGDEPDLSWTDGLSVNHKTGEVDPTIGNAVLILRNDPRLRGCVAVNQFSGRTVLRRSLPWRRLGGSEKENLWKDADDSNLLLFLEQQWKLSAEGKIRHAVAVIAEENAFHPVREYLDSLPAWDGVERVEGLLVRYMAADDNAYVRAATRKWLCAAVARIYEPGRKFDDMIVLVGQQGIGKSRLPLALSRGWFTDSVTGLGSKEAYESIAGSWIVELAELAATKRAEVETIKNFISKQEDVFRPAYGRNVVSRPRQCVFFGTTNEVEFLRDRTGNRRFWPITVRGVDRGQLIGLEDEVDQIWAEAKVYAMERHEPLWLDDKALYDMAAQAQDEHSVQDELVGMIEDYLDILLPENWETLTPEERRDYIQGGVTSLSAGVMRRDQVSITEIRVELCGEDRAKGGGNDQLSRRIANIMNTLPGWTRSTLRPYVRGYGRQRVYRRDGCPDTVEQALENARVWAGERRAGQDNA